MRRYSEAVLLVVGIGLVVAGVVLMFMQQHYESDFQTALLKEFHNDYRWQSIGGTYVAVSAVGAGVLLMIVAAALGTLSARYVEIGSIETGVPPRNIGEIAAQ